MRGGEPMTDLIPLPKIKDPGAQMRIEMRAETVNDYAEAMLNDADFPAVILYHDGTDYWLGAITVSPLPARSSARLSRPKSEKERHAMRSCAASAPTPPMDCSAPRPTSGAPSRR